MTKAEYIEFRVTRVAAMQDMIAAAHRLEGCDIEYRAARRRAAETCRDGAAYDAAIRGARDAFEAAEAAYRAAVNAVPAAR
jgi:hypothetical protein